MSDTENIARFDSIEGVKPPRPYSHEYGNGVKCYDPNPIVWANSEDCLHDEGLTEPDNSPTANQMAEQAGMIAGHGVEEFHVYWNEDHGQWEIGDCPNPFSKPSAEHTIATLHESWSHPNIGWTCADPLCESYNKYIAEAIEAVNR